VRIPIPVVLLLALAVCAGGWWHGTRHSDFLTPPSEERLAAIRRNVEASLPQADHPDDAVSVPAVIKEPDPPAPVQEPKPAMEFGDLGSPATLREYSDAAPKGAAHLINLAVLLEAEGEFQRALLAWERVLDMGKPDDGQTGRAIAAIKRLRPTLPDWNAQPTSAIAITLHAGTGKKTASTLAPVLNEVAKNLENASAGILKVTASVTTGRSTSSTKKAAPVALWLAGPSKESNSTEVLSFTVDSPKTLREDLDKTVFQIIRGYLSHGPSHTLPPEIAAGGNPVEALQSHITRLSWQELGTMLNRTAEKK
jgi:hypothetical protein